MDFFIDMGEELEFFFSDLNWTYIFIFSFVIYGIKFKEEFEWYNKLLSKLKSLKLWVTGLFILLLFVIFKHFEGSLDSVYIARNLRSWIIVIVFNSMLNRKIKKVDEK